MSTSLENNRHPGGNVYPCAERSRYRLCSMVDLETQYLSLAQCVLCNVSHMGHSFAQPL